MGRSDAVSAEEVVLLSSGDESEEPGRNTRRGTRRRMRMDESIVVVDNRAPRSTRVKRTICQTCGIFFFTNLNLLFIFLILFYLYRYGYGRQWPM